ncbi:Glucose-6-phosphate isomerase [Paramixta manurensis]|uniref:Glucose-6-phosphate isomerase n=1 Tax=Paramixta manurensis TaxID=2740817 RepID=A0A6M8UAQ9_9GAMM|nr:Glucose-6-phosphate isomerase [Erwiniaceae bacterium PD-1]
MKMCEPVSCQVDLSAGVMDNGSGHYQKRLNDLAGLYADGDAFATQASVAGDRVVYEVTERRPDAQHGDLIFGVTRMSPGKIGNEYFLTRGHIHAQADRPEIYYGQSGHGVMLMESPAGETRIVAIGPQSICYVPPYWIHRSVNVGAEDLVMVFAYPADSGQDYEIIARSGGMKTRIVDDGHGGWQAVDNADYQPRSPQQVARLFQTTL